jgi:hypothetical protein
MISGHVLGPGWGHVGTCAVSSGTTGCSTGVWEDGSCNSRTILDQFYRRVATGERAGRQSLLTSAAFAAALFASSGLVAPSLLPRLRPGVDVVILGGTLADGGPVDGGDAPSTRPGWEKLSGLFADFEQLPPMMCIKRAKRWI